MREGVFPPLAIQMTDEGEFTLAILLTLSAWFMRFVPTSFRPSDVARGFTLVPLTLVWDLSSIPSRYLIDWGVCLKNVPESWKRTLPYALPYNNNLSQAHDLPSTLFSR